jgi:predicted CoA-substrate-specific enzyme activase
MMKIGIDVGSTAIKIVFASGDQVAWKQAEPTKPGQSAVVENLIDRGLKACGISRTDIEKTCVTGYGRNLITAGSQVVDEIWANAAGIHRLSGGRAGTVINIGGQDVKVIKLSPNGEVTDFKMNDKCAAGTGRFFELTARLLDTPLEEFQLSQASPDPAAALNSTCAVFAESEMVSLMAKGISRHSIIKGLNQSVATRIANLAGYGILEEDVYVDGGPAMNRGLVDSLEKALFCDINVTNAPQFTVAFGSLFVDD